MLNDSLAHRCRLNFGPQRVMQLDSILTTISIWTLLTLCWHFVYQWYDPLFLHQSGFLIIILLYQEHCALRGFQVIGDLSHKIEFSDTKYREM